MKNIIFLLLLVAISAVHTVNAQTDNATGELMTQAENVVNLTSGAASNATLTALNNTMIIASNPSSNATSDAMREANEIINTASNASINATNVTETTMSQAENIPNHVTNNISPTTPNVTSNLKQTVMGNHTSDQYQIQFQYPSDWNLKEKTNRFEEGTDIAVEKVTPQEVGLISIGYSNETFGKYGELGIQPVTERVYVIYNAMMDDFTKDTVMIEQPTFVNIDGQKAGTFVLAQKDKYEENAINWGTQMWLVYSGNKSWIISFSAPTTMFDSAKNIEIRDNFIKSIKFLGLK